MSLTRQSVATDFAKLYSVTAQPVDTATAETQLNNFTSSISSPEASVNLTKAYAKTMNRQVISPYRDGRLEQVAEEVEKMRVRVEDIAIGIRGSALA